jgi:hypothetical protein
MIAALSGYAASVLRLGQPLAPPFFLNVNYLTLLERFLNHATERGRMGRPSGNVGLMIMAVQWGNNSLASGGIASWFFVRGNGSALPVIQVRPLSPSFTDDNSLETTSGGFPYYFQINVGTLASQLSDDFSHIVYFMWVSNDSNNAIEYAFLEADL